MEEELPLVVILFGGQSGEHQISCATAGGVLGAIDRTKWNPYAVGITPDGCWVPMPTESQEYALGEGAGYTVTSGSRRVAFFPGSPRLFEYEVDESGDVVERSFRPVGDAAAVFPLLHGPYGEDGTVQGLLELSAVPYVGCGVASSAVCQDKYLTKTVLGAAGIDVGKWTSFTTRQWEEERATCEAAVAQLGLPVFVKPCRAGSSLGVSRVDEPGALAEAVEEAQSHDPRVIVEAASWGREVECGVLSLADGTVLAPTVGEIRVLTEDFYDYEAKYFDDTAVALDCPASLPKEVEDRAKAIAKRAFLAVEGEGLSRIDFFYEEDTGRLVLNEINTLPGFTPASLYPVMMQEGGIPYTRLIDLLLQEAISRPKGLR